MGSKSGGPMFSVTTADGRRELTAPEIKKLERWRLSTFWVMLLGYVGYYLCRGNLPAAFPLLSQEFGYTNTQLGLIAAYSEIAYAIGKFIKTLYHSSGHFERKNYLST